MDLGDKPEDIEGDRLMSEADRRFVRAIAEETAQTTVARFFQFVEDPKNTEKAVDNLVGHLDKVLGRAVRRFLLLLLLLGGSAVATKFGWWDKLGGLFGGK